MYVTKNNCYRIECLGGEFICNMIHFKIANVTIIYTTCMNYLIL